MTTIPVFILPSRILSLALVAQIALLPVAANARAGGSDQCPASADTESTIATVSDELEYELQSAGGEVGMGYRDNASRKLTVAEVRKQGMTELQITVPGGKGILVETFEGDGKLTTTYSTQVGSRTIELARTTILVGESAPRMHERIAASLQALQVQLQSLKDLTPLQIVQYTRVICLAAVLMSMLSLTNGAPYWAAGIFAAAVLCMATGVGTATYVARKARRLP